jgi:hypothetical protein
MCYRSTGQKPGARNACGVLDRRNGFYGEDLFKETKCAFKILAASLEGVYLLPPIGR